MGIFDDLSLAHYSLLSQAVASDTCQKCWPRSAILCLQHGVKRSKLNVRRAHAPPNVHNTNVGALWISFRSRISKNLAPNNIGFGATGRSSQRSASALAPEASTSGCRAVTCQNGRVCLKRTNNCKARACLYISVTDCYLCCNLPPVQLIL